MVVIVLIKKPAAPVTLPSITGTAEAMRSEGRYHGQEKGEDRQPESQVGHK